MSMSYTIHYLSSGRHRSSSMPPQLIVRRFRLSIAALILASAMGTFSDYRLQHISHSALLAGGYDYGGAGDVTIILRGLIASSSASSAGSRMPDVRFRVPTCCRARESPVAAYGIVR